MKPNPRRRPILVVDDDEATLALESNLLAAEGYRVMRAQDGAEALRAIRFEKPSLVVLDVQMPGMDGPAFALQLRMQLQHIPLVVLTASPDVRRHADRCNAEAYLSKPFDASEFVRIVRRLAA